MIGTRAHGSIGNGAGIEGSTWIQSWQIACKSCDLFGFGALGRDVGMKKLISCTMWLRSFGKGKWHKTSLATSHTRNQERKLSYDNIGIPDLTLWYVARLSSQLH